MRTPVFSANTLFIVVGLLLFALVAYLLGPKPLPVDTAKLERGTLRIMVESEGRTRIRHIYTVTAPVSGRLLRVPLKAGDAVVAGQTVLTRIEPAKPEFLDARILAERQAKLSSSLALWELAKADIQRAEAALEYARADWKRYQALLEKHFASQQAVEQAQLAMRTKEAELAVARKTLASREAERAMDRARLLPTVAAHGAGDAIDLLAPVSGKVLRVLEESETSVTPIGVGKPVMEIGDPKDIEILAEMLSVNAAKVRVGAAALISGWGGKTLQGRVRRVEPYGFTKVSALGIEEQRVNVLVDFEEPVENWSAMEHGYRVDVQVTVWEHEQVLKIPMGALFREGDDWVAFRISADHRAELCRVKIGHSNSEEAEVESGLKDGDTVILHPSDRLRDGDFVMGKPLGQT